jgi:RimJ/RimL family protein N-acetyltransferase
LLRTQRLELRQHTEGNIEKLHKWFNDKELLFYDDEGAYEEISMEEMQELMTNRLMKCVLKDHKEIIHLGIHKVEVVENANCGELIGFCMIAFIDKYNKKCKLGITIGEKQEWGKGYAYEALQSLVDFCFDTLGLQRIEVGIYCLILDLLKYLRN